MVQAIDQNKLLLLIRNEIDFVFIMYVTNDSEPRLVSRERLIHMFKYQGQSNHSKN